MADLVATLFALGVFVAAGLVALWAVGGMRRPSMGWPLIGAVSFSLGLGAVSLQVLLYSIAGLPLLVAGLSVPWIVLVAVTLFASRGLGGVESGTHRPSHKWLVVGCAVVAGIQVVYCVVRAVSQPIAGWDAWAIWLLKAKAFFLSGGLPTTHFFSTSYLHPDYPLLTPLAVTWHYLCLGRVDDQLAKILFPLSFLALLIMFGYALTKETDRNYGFACTALLSLTPFVVIHAGGLDLPAGWGDYVGYADLNLAIYFWGGAAYLYLYQRDRNMTWFFLSALFLGLGAWTKNEGLTYAAIGSVLLITTATSWRYAIAALGLVAAFALPWQLFKWTLPLGNDIVEQARWLGVAGHLDRVPTILASAWHSMVGGGFGLLWVAFAASSLLNWRRMLGTPLRSSAILIGMQLSAYLIVYALTPRDLGWHLGTSIDRVLLHLAPLALWVTGLNAYQLAEEAGKHRAKGKAARYSEGRTGVAVQGVAR